MVRSFGLGDVLLIHRLQRRGMWLNPHSAVAGPEPPAWAALSAPIRWWGSNLVTYVSREAGGGVIQMRLRLEQAEADVVFLAPSPDEGEESKSLWRHLLLYGVQQAGEWRVQRLFASVPDDAELPLCVLQQVGFTPYTREDVYVRERLGALTAPSEPKQVRPLMPADHWALQKLYASVTPRLVQQAEGAGMGHSHNALPNWRASRVGEQFVLLRDDEVVGLVQTQVGKKGHCMTLLGQFQEAAEVRALLEKGWRALSNVSRQPAYCLVREYQSGVRIPLAEMGYRLAGSWLCLVKHTVARVKEPVRRPWHALEPCPEPSVPGAAVGRSG